MPVIAWTFEFAYSIPVFNVDHMDFTLSYIDQNRAIIFAWCYATDLGGEINSELLLTRLYVVDYEHFLHVIAHCSIIVSHAVDGQSGALGTLTQSTSIWCNGHIRDSEFLTV